MNRISATDTLHAAPENALVYSILSNADAVRHLSDGSFDPPKLTWVVLKSDGSSPTRLETLEACTAEGLTLKYKRNTDEAALEIEESMSHTLTEGMTDIALYAYKDGICVAEKVVKVVYDGPQGPGYYPAGSYNDKTTYKWNGVKMVPVVECGGLYYALQETEATKAGIKGINPKTDVANNGGNWGVFDMFQYIFAAVAFIQFAKLGSAVFYEQYMFSQQGIDAAGNAVISEDGYKDFDYSDPMNSGNAFRPNILFDFLRGKGWMNDVSVKGDINATSGVFNNVEFQSGKVAGFSVEGNSIVNSGFDNDATVLFRNDTYKTFAGIGGNVLPASTGLRAVARFENHDTTDQWGFAANYAMLLSAQGGHDNVALGINGGSIYGMAMKNTIIGTSVTSKTLERSDYNVVAINTSECTLTLPTMQLYDDGHVIRIKRLGNGGLKIRSGYCYTWNGTSYRYTRPVIVYDRNSKLTGTNTISFESICDAFELVWCRDLNYTIDGTTYYGAWVQYKLPRDW